MKSREETARFIEKQLDFASDYECQRDKGGCYHYGRQELRDLMDFIYDGKPENKEEELTNTDKYRK